MKTTYAASSENPGTLVDDLLTFLAIAAGRTPRYALQPVMASASERRPVRLPATSRVRNAHVTCRNPYPIVLGDPYIM